MGKIFVGQGNLRITLDTKIDLSSATAQVIKYKKPSGAANSWSATKSGTTIYYDVAAANLDEAGIWTVWAYVTFPGPKVVAGEPVEIYVSTEGT